MSQISINENTQQAVLQVQRKFWAALKEKDREAFEHVLADNFTLRTPEQPDQDRTEFINTLISFPGNIHSIGSDNLEVHLFGEIAVVTGVQTAQMELPNGQRVINRIAITNVFQFCNGAWAIKLAHAVDLK